MTWNNPADTERIRISQSLPVHPTIINAIVQAQSNIQLYSPGTVSTIQGYLDSLDDIESQLQITYSDQNWALNTVDVLGYTPGTKAEGLENYKAQLQGRIARALCMRLDGVIDDIISATYNPGGGSSTSLFRG